MKNIWDLSFRGKEGRIIIWMLLDTFFSLLLRYQCGQCITVYKKSSWIWRWKTFVGGRGLMDTFFSSSFAFSVADSRVLSRCFEMGSSMRLDSLPPSLTTYSWLPWTVPRRPSPFTSMVNLSSISEILLPFNLLLELIRICNMRFTCKTCMQEYYEQWNCLKYNVYFIRIFSSKPHELN